MDGFGQKFPAALPQATTAGHSVSAPVSQPATQDVEDTPRKGNKRRKVNHACLYCRRSHMTCDEGRPCQRCIKREIGHLCHDERRSKTLDKLPTTTPSPSTTFNGTSVPTPTSATPWPKPQYFNYQSETLGNEFSVLTDFLETLDDGSFFAEPQTQTQGPLMTSASAGFSRFSTTTAPQQPALSQTPASPTPQSAPPAVIPSATKTEKFLLTAADQESGSRDERLSRVIRSKYEAGLLKPYNYVKGYARLSRWMDRNVSQESKQQILQPLSVLRPKFRAVAQSLRDIDLVFIEEAFERMLLDYDRVFSAMGVPACLWRRTGEIYKGNREFSELVGVRGEDMRDGRLCIYELMAEESAVNYWEKYGHVAFDSSQKAVLTSCVLRYKPVLPSSTAAPNAASEVAKAASERGMDDRPHESPEQEGGFINCCFSFTIRRDKWGIPSMIVGNFIRT
ncbi:hypothetical protein MIND_00545100 [Mycena indigotica]|uniref:Zn(2)-C6 fungal-type domain-containing protein n=1 Tax=Mycena indigotica TaxID=2126181 RepID=A0A8H6SY03_9AGAR|nr:uncharacterized protein MIND_00545100 [Mycena indigotica]KAF7307506.1 hypothetical protein MIND_00545100 [Mycena indigotica]